MVGGRSQFEEAVRKLVDEYRLRCLWFLRPDFYPTDDASRLRALDYIERHGDREGFRRAATLRQWLSRGGSADRPGRHPSLRCLQRPR